MVRVIHQSTIVPTTISQWVNTTINWSRFCDILLHSAYLISVTMNSVDRLLLIDDDAELGGMLKEYLRRQSLALDVAFTGDKGLEQFRKETYALVLLDVMLPGRDGFDVLRELRTISQVDVIMLTARGEDVDRIVGLEMGADDYMPKPFNPRELLARIRAVQRRKEKRTSPSLLEASGIMLDSAQRSARYHDHDLELTSVEFELLKRLLESAGQVVNREILTQSALGREFQAYDRSLDMHVSRLRKKLEAAGAEECIKTVRSIGYQLVLLSSRGVAEVRSH
jgi:two-component system response regulator CpxR